MTFEVIKPHNKPLEKTDLHDLLHQARLLEPLDYAVVKNLLTGEVGVNVTNAGRSSN